MLRSLPCERMVVAISYGCIGRSVSVTRTASASRFETARRPAIWSPAHLVHPATYIRQRVYGYVYPSASTLTARGGWWDDPVDGPCGGARRAHRGRGRPDPPRRGRLDARIGIPLGGRAGQRPLFHLLHRRQPA